VLGLSWVSIEPTGRTTFALDRFSRDQEDTAGLFKRLTFAGVRS